MFFCLFVVVVVVVVVFLLCVYGRRRGISSIIKNGLR